MRQESLDFLKALINAPSPSGFEGPAAKIWRDYLADVADQVHGDVYGNSIAVVNPSTDLPKIMLCGHLDEIGFMVHYINDEGFIYMSPIGGIDPVVAAGRDMIIHNKNGPIRGVTGRIATHLQSDDDDDTLEFHKMYVDIGAKDKEDALTMVSIGDPIVVDVGFRELANNRIVARGLDDRMGAFCVAETLVALAASDKLAATVYGVGSVQEEIGAHGATIASFKLNPKAAIAIDVTHATDTPDITKEKSGDIKLGEGPVISIGSIVHRKISAMLQTIAADNRIPLQVEAAPCYSGSDADVIFTTRSGIATGLVSVPNRYMHTPVEVVQIDDLENTIKLLTAWCEEIDDDISFII
jgi:endoglucanase